MKKEENEIGRLMKEEQSELSLRIKQSVKEEVESVFGGIKQEDSLSEVITIKSRISRTRDILDLVETECNALLGKLRERERLYVKDELAKVCVREGFWV